MDEPSGTRERPTGARIAMALYGDVTHDSRVLREAATLAEAGHAVTIHCLSGTAPPHAPFRVVSRQPGRSTVLPGTGGSSRHARPPSRPTRVVRRALWVIGYARNIRAWGGLAAHDAGDVDVWHAHDLTGLLAIRPHLRRSTRLVYDSHEIFMESAAAARLPRPLRGVLSLYERVAARRALALVTVNEGYAEVLRRRLRPRRTVIVRNCPPRWTPPTPPSTRLRDAAGVPASAPILLYHGIFARSRGIEQLIDALMEPGLETAHVVLLGMGDTRPELELRASDHRLGGRLHVLEAVPPDELLDWVSGADAAVSLLHPVSRDHTLSTPNKLWESLAAGVPVIASDFPVLRRIVLDGAEGPVGAVCDPSDPASIAAVARAVIQRPPDERAAVRARCLDVAHRRWNWETESARLVDLYADILAAP